MLQRLLVAFLFVRVLGIGDALIQELLCPFQAFDGYHGIAQQLDSPWFPWRWLSMPPRPLVCRSAAALSGRDTTLPGCRRSCNGSRCIAVGSGSPRPNAICRDRTSPSGLA